MSIKKDGCLLYDVKNGASYCTLTGKQCNFVPKRCNKLNNKEKGEMSCLKQC